MQAILSRRRSCRDDGRKGVVLISAMLLLFLLFFMVGSTQIAMRSSAKSSVHDMRERMAFYQAEAGAKHVIAHISGHMTLSWSTNEIANCSTLAGYRFSTNVVLQISSNKDSYVFVTTGVYDNARAAIEVTLGKKTLLAGAMMSHGTITLRNGIGIYSYDSSILQNPTAPASTGEATVGSNSGFSFGSVFLDGMLLLGATVSGSTTNPVPPPSGFASNSVSVGVIEMDPLGATNGPLSVAFARALNSNNNSRVSAIVNKSLSMSKKDPVTMTSGVYYLENIDMGPQSELTINATPTNPVVIYLHGPMNTQPGVDITVTSGRPCSFFIFSNSDDDIRLQPNGDFQCFLYAPYASLRMQPGGNFQGVIFARSITMQPGGLVFEDTSLMNQFSSREVLVRGWRRL